MADPLQIALQVAFRNYDAPATTEAERDAILRAMADHMPSAEAEAASRLLFHREHGRKQQLLLTDLLSRRLAPLNTGTQPAA